MLTTSGHPVRVAVLDDQGVLREAISDLLNDTGDATVVCSVRQSDESLESIAKSKAAVVLVGLDAQGHDPIALVHRASRVFPKMALCAMVACGQPAKVRAALAAGCWGAVSSGATVETVVDALGAIAGGQAYVDTSLSSELLGAELFAKTLQTGEAGRD